MKKTWLLYILLILLAVPLIVGAPPPFQPTATFESGLVISHPAFSFHKSGAEIELHIHVYNKSNGYLFDNNSVNCTAHLYNSTGHEVLDLNFTDYNGQMEHLYITAPSGVTTEQVYGWKAHCSLANGVGGFTSGSFKATETGENDTNLDATSGLVTFIFVFGFTIIMFALPFIVRRMSNHPIVDDLLKRLCWLLGLWLLMFDTGVVAQIAAEANLGLGQEIFMFLKILGLAVYPFMIFIMFQFLVGALKYKVEKKKKRNRGEHDESET